MSGPVGSPPPAYHRDLAEARIVSCPDHSLDGRTFAEVATERGDLTVVDPEYLDERVEEIHEEEMAGFDGLRRLVRRNDETVRAVLVNGRVAWRGGTPAPDLGVSGDYGTFLPLAG